MRKKAGTGGHRSRCLMHAKHALYHLSYYPALILYVETLFRPKNCKGKYNLFCLFDGVEYYPLIPSREKLIGDIAQRNEDRKKVKEIVEMMDELIYDEDDE